MIWDDPWTRAALLIQPKIAPGHYAFCQLPIAHVAPAEMVR